MKKKNIAMSIIPMYTFVKHRHKMKKFIDHTGQTFQFYKVIERAPPKGNKTAAFWRCLCKCGNERIVRGDMLRNGEANSCGCKKTSIHRLKNIFDRKYRILENGCWDWLGSRDQDGYPNLGDKGRKAHRYSYERFKGEIPKGSCVCHSCDSPGCVNPRHLFLGTQAQNIEDKVKKGRQTRGEKQHTSKLTKDVVINIRLRYVEGNITMAELGNEHGVSTDTIWKVIHKKTWKHVN